ncbi:hypothetical protein A9Q89_01355 [Gammaproteobacteria bacterium 53_120_T64]|nr:hypothetical protein A9Q89_01355 [Gammaproteobacteria bacterium 53_120_T64]
MNHFASDNIRLIIAHTLTALGNYSAAAENLLIVTISLQEKHFSDNSGGLGLYLIDSATHLNIWDNYLAFDPDRASTVRGLASQQAFLQDPHLELLTNLAYATAIAWSIYQRNDVSLPPAEDLPGLTACWAQYFADKGQLEHAQAAALTSSANIIALRPRAEEERLQA